MIYKKRVGLGHAITQATRPRSVISHILFGLGVEVDHVFGSEWLLNQLYSLGFSISYTEVSRFKQAMLQDNSLSNIESSNFDQYAADNADVNIATVN